MVRFTKHIHAAVGVVIKIEFTLAPPFVIVTPEPVATITTATEDRNFLGHEHDMEELPDISISASHQEMIGKQFMTHSHYYFASGLSLVPPGTFVSNVGFTAPPFDDILSKQEFLMELKKDYSNYFQKTFFQKNNNYNFRKVNWVDFLNQYNKDNLEALSEKFSNHG